MDSRPGLTRPAGEGGCICIVATSAPSPDPEPVHETALAAEILKIARASAEANGGGRLTAVSIVVGELSAVEPDLIAFAWEAVTSGTDAAGSTLEVEFRRARQICRVCGDVAERAAGSWLRLCPRCQEPLRVEGGDELDVARVTFEEMEA